MNWDGALGIFFLICRREQFIRTAKEEHWKFQALRRYDDLATNLATNRSGEGNYTPTHNPSHYIKHI